MNVHRLAKFANSAAPWLPEQARDNLEFRRAVLLVTLFLWVSDCAVLNSRDFLSEDGLKADLALMRVGVIMLGCGLCYLFHLVISKTARKSFRQLAIVPDELRSTLVPSHILQPLMENAVKHGIANNPKPAEIKLTAAIEGDWLSLDVSDDGLEPGGLSARRTGIGLTNVHDRLVRRFGDCCTLKAGRATPRGFHVHIIMPLRFAQ